MKHKIMESEAQLIKMLTAQELKEDKERMGNILSRFRIEIERTKKNKCVRDYDDYSKGQVFQLQLPIQGHFNHTNKRTKKYNKQQNKKKKWDTFGFTTASSSMSSSLLGKGVVTTDTGGPEEEAGNTTPVVERRKSIRPALCIKGLPHFRKDISGKYFNTSLN